MTSIYNPRDNLFEFPERVQGSMPGSMFGSSIMSMPSSRARDLAIFQQLSLGNIPAFLRCGIPITIQEDENILIFWAMPDYLAIGDDDDFLRMPMRPTTAQKAAALYGATLPTRKMVNAIHYEMEKLWMKGMSHLPMTAVSTIIEHNDFIQGQLEGRAPGKGVDGHKKSVVLARGRPSQNVAIYGGYAKDGKIIQGPQIQKTAHIIEYDDYSHGIRFVFSQVMVNAGLVMEVSEVLQHPKYHVLLSDEGVYAEKDCAYSTEI